MATGEMPIERTIPSHYDEEEEDDEGEEEEDEEDEEGDDDDGDVSGDDMDTLVQKWAQLKVRMAGRPVPMSTRTEVHPLSPS